MELSSACELLKAPGRWVLADLPSASIARKTLKYAEQKGMIDHDNFLAYGVALAFFTLGTVGMIGSDDILW